MITGDITQIDLFNRPQERIGVSVGNCGQDYDIAVVQFSEKDVVRHNLVQQIIRAYEEHDMSSSRQLPLRPKVDQRISRGSSAPIP